MAFVPFKFNYYATFPCTKRVENILKPSWYGIHVYRMIDVSWSISLRTFANLSHVC